MRPSNPLVRVGAELRQASQDAALLALGRAHPDWHVWRSPLGAWYATHRSNPTQPTATAKHALSAPTVEALSELLADRASPPGGTRHGSAPARVPATPPNLRKAAKAADRLSPRNRPRGAVRQAGAASCSTTMPRHNEEPAAGKPAPAPGDALPGRQDHQAGASPAAVLLARPVTRPWCDGSGALFSWEVPHPSGSASGITSTQHRAMHAVTAALHEFGGRHGIVQQACLGVYREDERDQYSYGRVIAHARVVDGIVEWVTRDR